MAELPECGPPAVVNRCLAVELSRGGSLTSFGTILTAYHKPP